MEKICTKLDIYQKALISNYKRAGRKAKEVFSISSQFLGLPKKIYSIYFGFQLLAYSDSKKGAINLRNQLFNNI